MSQLRIAAPALFAVCALLLLSPGAAQAEDPNAPAPNGPAAAATPKPPPVCVSDEEAKETLAEFKKAFKARGLRGEEKIGEQAHQIRQLAETQHAKVVDQIAKLTRHRTIEVRTEAVLQLGKQRALPARAGKAVLKAMAKNEEDHTFVMAGLEAIGALGYMGAGDVLRKLLQHPEYAIVKNALITMGELEDSRFIEDIIKLMKKLKLEKGAKWEGVSVTYDTGTAGDGDQKMAEKLGKAAEAKNKRKGKRAARSQRDLGPIVLEVAKELTGQEFTGAISARKWADKNKKQIAEMHKRDVQREKNQTAKR